VGLSAVQAACQECPVPRIVVGHPGFDFVQRRGVEQVTAGTPCRARFVSALRPFRRNALCLEHREPGGYTPRELIDAGPGTRRMTVVAMSASYGWLLAGIALQQISSTSTMCPAASGSTVSPQGATMVNAVLRDVLLRASWGAATLREPLGRRIAYSSKQCDHLPAADRSTACRPGANWPAGRGSHVTTWSTHRPKCSRYLSGGAFVPTTAVAVLETSVRVR
jgi:hypothetical protein